MPTRVNLDDLGEQHPAEDYDWVGVTPPEHPNGMGEPVWLRVTGKALEQGEPMPVQRQLHVVAQDREKVRAKLAELGYDAKWFLDDEMNRP